MSTPETPSDAPHTPDPDEALVDLRSAAQSLIDGAHHTYRARNGRQVSIEADDGEACLIVHSDLITELRAALAAMPSACPAPFNPAGGPGEAVSLPYRNWRGETAVRSFIPRRLWWGSDEWHPEPQWLLTALDVEKGAERDFALSGFEAAAMPSACPAGDYFGQMVAQARHAAAKAARKFPQPNYVTLKIAEEAGEVVRGAVHYAEGRMEWSEVEGEIVQLLAMLIRFVTEGDQVNGVVPPAAHAPEPAAEESPDEA